MEEVARLLTKRKLFSKKMEIFVNDMLTVISLKKICNNTTKF